MGRDNAEAKASIKITPEMISAGAEALRGYDLDGDMPEEAAIWVFEAMYRKHLQSEPQEK